MSPSPITSHVLDTSLGRPASGIRIELHQRSADDSWALLGSDVTNEDGRAKELCPAGFNLAPGVLRLTFYTGDYFARSGVASFYPLVEITFEISDPAQHYHVPLLLNPFGYSTYRGS